MRIRNDVCYGNRSRYESKCATKRIYGSGKIFRKVYDDFEEQTENHTSQNISLQS